MQTFTGKQFWPLDPRADEVEIIDIAHALSLMCRYNGHCEWFYSVAQHSVYVSHQVPPELALEGLLHDAAEAYCADIIRPLKKHLFEYAVVEARIADAIAERFNTFSLLFECPAVKHADYAVGEAEKLQILKKPRSAWAPYPSIAPIRISPWTHSQAETAFLDRYLGLISAR